MSSTAQAPLPTDSSDTTATAAAIAAPPDSALPVYTATLSPVEVTREAVEIFGDTIPLLGSESVVADSGNGEEPSWDIDVRSYETHRRVEFYVNVFKTTGRMRFAEWLARGGRYDAMIRAKLQAAGLPQDLTYLALIESGYNPHAYSSAAAVGMWQIMTTTAKGTGLRVDWWVDERRDPVRSTDAAIKFLGWLNEQFGSLYLAAAAYNGGPGRIARGLSRYADDLEGTSGDDTFFALAEKSYLRPETKDYVPKMIAAALVAKDPARYGLNFRPLPAFVYDTVRVPAFTPIAAVATASKSTVYEIRDLNPHILRGVTPANGSFTVRVPVGKSVGFDSAFRALPAAERRAFSRLTSKKGESRVSLARRGGVTSRQLGWYNKGLKVSKRGTVYSGQTVLIPSMSVALAAFDVADPSIERYGRSRATHLVKRGESLGLIAKKYRTSVNTLMRLNGLRKSVIFPGQVIVVRGSVAKGKARRSAKRER